MDDDATINICHLPNGAISNVLYPLFPKWVESHCLQMICAMIRICLACWLYSHGLITFECKIYLGTLNIRQLFHCLPNKAPQLCFGPHRLIAFELVGENGREGCWWCKSNANRSEIKSIPIGFIYGNSAEHQRAWWLFVLLDDIYVNNIWERESYLLICLSFTLDWGERGSFYEFRFLDFNRIRSSTIRVEASSKLKVEVLIYDTYINGWLQ